VTKHEKMLADAIFLLSQGREDECMRLCNEVLNEKFDSRKISWGVLTKAAEPLRMRLHALPATETERSGRWNISASVIST
jgi:hypothetical protein